MTATAVSSTPSSVGVGRYRPDIQGLRAIAVLVVIAFHAGLPLSGGFTGVDMFFVISGFVITGLILREHLRGRFSPATFFARRAKRLLPALALMTAVVLVLTLLFLSPYGPQQQAANTAIGAMLLVANMVILRTQGDYFDAAAEANPLLHTWSLSVEEQFYLVFPFVLLGLLIWAARRGRSLIFVLAALGLMNLVSFALSTALSFGWSPADFTSQPQSWAFYTSITRAWEFGIGAMLAVWLAHRSQRQRTSVNPQLISILGILGLALVAAAMVVISPESVFPGVIVLLPTVGTLLLLWAGANSEHQGAIQRGLSSPTMVYLGDRSYSLYLWHWPIIYFAVILFPGSWIAVIAAAVSFIPALASFRFVEQPLRLSKNWVGRKVAIGGIAMAGAVIVLALGVRTFGIDLVPGASRFAADRDVPTISNESGCVLDRDFQPNDIDRCTFTAPSPRGWILLAGDSHAAALSTGVVTVAKELNFDVVALAGADCPFALVAPPLPRVTNCAELNDALLSKVLGPEAPSLVMVSNKGVPPGSREVIEIIAERGIPIAFIRDVPRWNDFKEWAGGVPCVGGAVNFRCEVPESLVAVFDSGNRGIEADLLLELPQVVSYDPWPRFCSDGTCSPLIGNRLAYSDAEHLNGIGSAALTDDLRAVMEQALARQ